MNPISGGPAAADTLLIVDDLAENLEILGELLRDSYSVRAANSGAAALRYAAMSPQPALILLDVMMPDMDGYDVLQRLRQDPATRDIPVIFLTALDDADDIARGLRLGAADYISKPIQPEVLLARVRNQLDARRARELLRNQNDFLEAEVARRMAELQQVQADSERTRALLNHQREQILVSAAEGIFGVDAQGVINFANPAAAALLGYERQELVGRRTDDLLPAAGGARLSAYCVGGIDVRDEEEAFRRKDGSELSLQVSCTPIREDGQLVGSVVTLQDISERKRYLEQLERKSNYDDLTGLPNRNLLNDRLAHALERCRKEGGEVAVLAMNLDRFKSINDNLGRAAGDRVLRELTERFSGRVRKMDTLARIDGDEFVLVAEAGEPDVAMKLVPPLKAALTQPFVLDDHEFYLSGSIGIALFPKDGEDSETLLKHATVAMYRAKAAGGDCFQYYTAEMNARSLERLEMESELRHAIARDELEVYYQPQLSLRTGEIIGAEALVRWNHPRRGLVLPGEFISLAEETGLILPLGEWVLRAACRQNAAWQTAGLSPITVAVNMSARQFGAQDVVGIAGNILRETGLNPEYLELELTESAVMADAEAFIVATEQLKGLSITLSIDDFGTGFSSLSYLKRFAVDRLKVDQSFVRDMTNDPNSAAIAVAIISLAHNLKMSAIAEGVETEAQVNFLRHRNCDEMQGYYFSPPVPAPAFEAMLREGRRLALKTDNTSTSRTLLLVDDEPSILSSLKRLFRREGYFLLTAESGEEGLELLASNPVGVVISDARMPAMSGAEFLGKVRELYPDTIRMILSGYTELSAVTSAVNRGELFGFFTKPWNDDELLEAVRDAFRHFEQRQQGRQQEHANLPQ